MPDQSTLQTDAREFPTAVYWGFTTIITAILFIAGLFKPCMSPDSWSYLELSNSVFGDFFRINTLRQFEVNTAYGNSFPPLWPVVIAISRSAFDLGIYTAYVLNFLLCLSLSYALMKLARRMDLPEWVGAATYLFLLGFDGFIEEALAARSIPLSILLLTTMLLLLIRPTFRHLDAAACGVLMGLNVLNRFDMLLAAAVVGPVIIYFSWSRRERLSVVVGKVLIYCVVLFATLLPFIRYNVSHFGSPLASDNSRQVRLAHAGHVMNYYENSPELALPSDLHDWFSGLVQSKIPRMIRGLGAIALRSHVLELIGIAAVTWGALRPLRLPRATVQFIAASAVLGPFVMLPSLVVGYGEMRYYTPVVLMLTIVCFAVIQSTVPDAWHRRRVVLLLAVVACTSVPASRIMLSLAEAPPKSLDLRKSMEPVSPTPEMQQLSAAVWRDAGSAPHRLLFMSDDAFCYGALTGEPTSTMPRLVDGTFAAFARDFQITHVYDPNDELANVDTYGVELTELDIPNLFRLSLYIAERKN
jgi:hypothetical protein